MFDDKIKLEDYNIKAKIYSNHFSRNPLSNISGRFPEILGRWCIKGIGKNVSGSWLSQCVKCIPNGRAHGALKLPSKVQGQNLCLGPAIIRGLKIPSLGLLNTRQVLKNKEIIKSLQKITKRLSTFRKFCYSKKGLTHLNKNDKTILYMYVSLIYEETSFVRLRKLHTLWAV